MVDLGAVYFLAWQQARTTEDWGAHVEKVETRKLIGHIQVGLKKCADGPDVFPISLKHGGTDFVRGDGVGNDVFAKIREGVVEELENDVAVENVNAHGGQEKLVTAFDAELTVPGGIEAQRIQLFFLPGLFDEMCDPFFPIYLHDTERTGLAAGNGNCCDGDISAGLAVLINDVAEIHAVQ